MGASRQVGELAGDQFFVLTVDPGIEVSAERRALFREIAAAPPPTSGGVRARSWRVERRSFRGRYLFATRDDREDYVRAIESDDAVTRLREAVRAPRPTLTTGEVTLGGGMLDRPVFIISAPRAGSTLLYETLSLAGQLWTLDGEAHGVIEGVPVLHPASRGFESHRLGFDDATSEVAAAVSAGLLADMRDVGGNRYLSLGGADRPDTVRLLEKTPENALRVAFLHRCFPDARFIFLHRDMRQNISSIVEAWTHGGFVNIPTLPDWERGGWCFLLPPEWRRFRDSSISDIAAFQWRSANECALDDLETVPPAQWTEVEYEDLVSAPVDCVRRLCRFMEIDCDARLEQSVARGLRTSSTTITPPSPGKWRHNRDLDPRSYAGMWPIAGRLRTLTAHAPPPPRLVLQPGAPRFSCLLREVTMSEACRSDSGLVVDPSFQFQRGPSIPLPLLRRTRFRERFLADHPVLWVEDAWTRVLHPFWADRRQIGIFDRFVGGRAPPVPLDSELAERLVNAGILTTEASRAARSASGTAVVGNAHRHMEHHRFSLMPAVLPDPQRAALARYYRALMESGDWALGDGQVERRYGRHNEPMARFYHHQFTDLVSRIAGEPVKPAYAYSSAYRGGAALHAHVDRKQCEFTMSLLIDESAGAKPWPLYFQSPLGRESVVLGLGDAVLFRGCELPHWREPAPDDRFATMLLFHFVPAAFAESLD